VERQRVFVLCPRLPYPPLKGDQLRAYYFLKELCEGTDLEIFGLHEGLLSDETRSALNGVSISWRSVRLGRLWPKLRALFSLATPWPAQVAYFFSPRLAWTIHKHLKENGKPDVALLVTVRTAGYLFLFKDVPLVLDHIDSMSLNAEKRAKAAGNPIAKLFWRLESRKLRRIERRVGRRVRVQLATAKRDADALSPMRVEVVPNGVDLGKYEPREKEKQIDAVFTGNMSYPMNTEAAMWFSEKVLPLILSSDSDFTFYAVGAEPPRTLRQAADERHVFVTGYVDDVSEYLNQARVFVAPIRHATGIQNKVLEAMSCGMAVVATPEATEAIEVEENAPVLTALEPREFAERIATVLSDPELAEDLGRKARRFVEDHFSWRSQAEKVQRLLLKARKLHVEYKWELETGWSHPESEWLEGAELLREENSLVRVFEQVFAAVALVLLSPVLLALCLSVLVEDGWPPIYRQVRVGKGGKPFELLKLRTMRKDAEKASGAAFCDEDDPRVLRLGRVFRKLHLDELFQLINIAKGEMSLVGPRPERPEFVNGYREKIGSYDLRHAVRPGITGWAQVNYPYAASFEDAFKKLGYDLFYIRHRNLGLLLKILFRTPVVALTGWGAR